MGLHLHLDAIGGIAGDMFLAALIDARPELAAVVTAAIDGLATPEGLTVAAVAHRDGTFAGTRFAVQRPHEHPHRTLDDVLALIGAGGLAPAVGGRAADMFRRLAAAEARVHGIDIANVHLHEVSGWDSIADIVGAAAAIEALGIGSCSVSDLPLGSGRVRSAHGPLPVPAPATAALLDGYRFVDDGHPGERVTPTGAVILRHLEATQDGPVGGRRIAGQGFGFGTRTMDGLSNVLRALLLGTGGPGTDRDRVGEVAFEVDDQSAEDLAQGLDRLRDNPHVLDVIQSPAFGKKGRLAVAIRVLCAPAAMDEVADACLSETATLGVRLGLAERRVLARRMVTVQVHGRPIRVKVADRPDGSRTAKAEAEDLAGAGSAVERRRLAQAAERTALDEDERDA